ncbi:MAG: 50S ribosomal protein L24 [Patescibacteria group bacterium]
MYIRKDDNVIVIAGKDKGKTGKVLKALPKVGKVVVEAINIKKKTEKSKRRGHKGQIVEKALPIDVSNVMLIDPKSKKKTRIGFEIKGNKKIRISRRSKLEV